MPDGKFWNREIETLDRKELEKLQLERLKGILEWVYNRVPFYKDRFDEAGVKPSDCKSLEDLRKFPFTSKSDLRYAYPFGLSAVPMHEVVRVHMSSGTTGKPITVLYTKEDMDIWAECVARNLWAAGVRPGDVVQNSYGIGLFTGGFGFQLGAELVGCTVIPVGTGRTERQVIILRDFKVTVLLSTPFYALEIAERAKELGIRFDKLPLRVGIFGAEPWSEAIRREIEEKLGLRAMEAYGVTEMQGPGVAYDCEERCGLHVCEDHFIVEIIDPVTEEPLPPGEKGELVLTSITRRAMPLIRYRVGDITSYIPERCGCGRTLGRIERIASRTDDMIIVSGVNVFPSQVEAILLGFPELEPHYVIVLYKRGHLDKMKINVEAKKDIWEMGSPSVARLKSKIEKKMESILGLNVEINVVEPGILSRGKGKVKKIIDERGKS